ncbi:alpha-ketoglutarate-dependent dioxygenase AlkB [Candidatus Parcubacteria bacterium]|nr:alpha-ketoglutarate-dependent dioxygenase AlkB [Candidatus Parcubacteria bacterium]
MTRPGNQNKLFDTGLQLPTGLVYRPDFITPEEELEILSYIEDLPLEEAQYKEYTAKRRHFSLGWGYDFDNKKFIPGPPLPPFLRPVQIRIGKWLDIDPKRIVEALINEYSPGSALGWHRDNEGFEHVIGLSLSGWARMRFRPIKRREEKKDLKDVVALELEPRSVYVMQKDIRWNWQHSVAKTKTMRYSITFRTLP